MMQLPTVNPQQLYQTAPTYNAVKIDIHNPSVNAPGAYSPSACAPAAAPVTAPIYEVPKASIYEVPQQTVYAPQQNFNAPQAAQDQPSIPQPVIIPPTVAKAPVEAPAPAAQAPAAVATATATATVAPAPEAAPAAPAVPAQTVEVKTPESAAPQVDLNAFLGKLTNENYDEQANAMESIAELAQNSPQKATELLDVKVIDTLLGIMSKDSSKLAGPTPKQLEIREKIMSKKPVTEPETAEANQITPMEQVERNKQYALYTTAILQKLYGSEVQKLNSTVVPLTELPGAAGIVEQVKTNKNPMVRASAVDALSYVQRPEYKQDLTTLFTIAKNDKDASVKDAATKALDKLAQMPVEAPAAQAAAPVKA